MSGDTGPSSPYDAHDEGIVESALDSAFADWDAGPGAGGAEPSRMQVTAQVEWNGVVDRARGGVRTTRLHGLQLAALRPALKAARAASTKAERAAESGPARSYTAKGWHAQLNALTKSARGSALADRAGLDPSRRTLMAWLSGERAPSKANQARIAEAYAGLRTARADSARESAEAANHRLADKLNQVLGDAYGGAEIRLREIVRMFFQ